MKKLLIALFFISSFINAQESKHEKIKALKVAAITDALQLTPSEAEKFWPIYNEFDQKMDVHRRLERKEMGVLKDDTFTMLSDDQANALLDKLMAINTAELNDSNELVQQLRNVIPPKKVLLLKKAEDDFKRQLLKQMREKKKLNE